MARNAVAAIVLFGSASLCGAFAPMPAGIAHHAAAGRGLTLFSRPSRPSSAAPLRMQVMPDSKPNRRAALAIPAIALLVPAIAFAASPSSEDIPANLEQIRSTLDISLALLSTLFFIRIPISWYPQMDLNKLPQAIVCVPTEPILKLIRGLTPPLFGVDISPIVVYGILSFVREIFLGQQGLLIMMAAKQG